MSDQIQQSPWGYIPGKKKDAPKPEPKPVDEFSIAFDKAIEDGTVEIRGSWYYFKDDTEDGMKLARGRDAAMKEAKKQKKIFKAIMKVSE